MTSTGSYWQLHGATLVDNGYRVLPIMPGSKKPGIYSGGVWRDMPGWQKFAKQDPTDFHLNLWSSWPNAGVGVLCGDVIGVDIDILDADVSSAVKACILRELGGTPLERVGRHPKSLLLYRAESPFTKISMQPIEVLAAGQQFLAFATHPETGQPYQWIGDTPVDVPVSKLPCVTEAQVRAAVAKAYELVPPEMRRQRLPSTPGAHASGGNLEGLPEAVSEAAAAIENNDLQWDDWNRVGMAIYAASSGSGFEAFEAFSKRSTKYDAKETAKRWKSYERSPPTQVGMGTLVHLAMEHGWQPEPSLPFNENKVVDTRIDFSGLLAKGAAKAAEPLPVRPAPSGTKEKEKFALPSADLQGHFPAAWYHTPSLVGRMVRWIVATAEQPLPTLALANTLATLGTVYGRRYRSQKSYTHTNVMVVGIARTGDGKEHSRSLCKAILKAAGLSMMIGGDEFKSGASITGMLAEFPSRLCSIDEFGLYLGSINDKKAAGYKKEVGSVLLRVFSSSGKEWHGAEYADRKNTPRVDIISPNLNIYGTTTPETLIDALDEKLIRDGTMSRLLLMPAYDKQPRNHGRDAPDVPDDLAAELRASASVKPASAGNLQGEQGIKEALPAYITVTWGDEVEHMLRATAEHQDRLRDTEAGALWVRLREYVIKVAMIEAISRDPAAPVITEEIVTMAYELVEWCTQYSVSLMANHVSSSDAEDRWKRILDVVKKHPSGAPKTLITLATKDLTTRERDDVLRSLVDGGVVTETKEAPARGRPTLVYRAA
jgi:hypothetical protein